MVTPERSIVNVVPRPTSSPSPVPDRLPGSTTAAGLLGLLALRPWSTYDLTAQARRSLRFVLPRAESVLYAEPKRLVAKGFAAVREELTGRRRRRVYEITPTGREALREWLATEPGEPLLDVEPLLRVLFADCGDLDDLGRALRALDDWAAARLTEGGTICRGYLAGDAPFPGRLHLNALIADFYVDLYRITRAWVERAEAEVSTWPSTEGVGLTPGARAMVERVVALTSGPDGSDVGPTDPRGRR